jgi:hypothetical protein
MTAMELSKRRPVFGEPAERPDGTTVIPVTTGYGRALGIFVVSQGKAAWVPVIDVTRIALFGEFIGLAAAIIGSMALLRRPPWPDITIRK